MLTFWNNMIFFKSLVNALVLCFQVIGVIFGIMLNDIFLKSDHWRLHWFDLIKGLKKMHLKLLNNTESLIIDDICTVHCSTCPHQIYFIISCTLLQLYSRRAQVTHVPVRHPVIWLGMEKSSLWLKSPAGAPLATFLANTRNQRNTLGKSNG